MGVLAIVVGVAAILLGLSDGNVLYVIFGPLFAGYGGWIVVKTLSWMSMKPPSALRLYDDHFCIGSRKYSYTSVLGVKAERTKTHKRVNFVPSGVDEHIVAKLTLVDEVVWFRAGVGPSTWATGSFGSAEVENFIKELGFLEWRARQPDFATEQDHSNQ